MNYEDRYELADIDHDSREDYFLYNYETGEIENCRVMGYRSANINNRLLSCNKQWLTKQELEKVDLSPSPVEFVYIFKSCEDGKITTMKRPLEDIEKDSSGLNAWFNMFCSNNELITVLKD